MWEEYTPHNVDDWLEEEEVYRLKAFKHVRNSVAHGYKGTRADTWKKEFENHMPFSGIEWNEEADTIDISNSSVPIDCLSFMQELNKKLVVRLHTNKQPSEE